MMLFGVPIDPSFCLAVGAGAILALCGVHAWTEGRRFERLHGGRGIPQAARHRRDDRAILIFRRAPKSSVRPIGRP